MDDSRRIPFSFRFEILFISLSLSLFSLKRNIDGQLKGVSLFLSLVREIVLLIEEDYPGR